MLILRDIKGILFNQLKAGIRLEKQDGAHQLVFKYIPYMSHIFT